MHELQIWIVFPVVFMNLLKFHRVKDIFDFTFKIRARQDF